MKTIFPVFPLLPILFFTFSLNAQIVEDWTEPVALTDSTNNNSNPVVAVYPYDNPELYMFYEKGEEPFREIWWRKISEPMSEEQMLFGVYPEFDHRNPQVLFSNFLIFECNIFENYDLFGVKFDENGLAGDIFRLTNTESNESALFGYMDYYSNLCCWVSEGNIYTAELQVSQDTLKFTDIEIIDSGDCYNPVCQEHYIAWRKVENNESHIYYSEKNWSTNQWSYPAAIIDTGNNINLALSISVPELSGWGYNLCWQAEDKIYFSDLDGDNIYSPEIPGIEKYYEPTAFNMIWLTDYISDLYSFAGGTESQRDIYIVDEDVSNYVLNITDDPYINKNPRLFIGRNVYGYDDYEIINIWQTEINGYDVLYSSYALYNVVIGSIDDSKMSQLDIYPNPVTSIAKIKINLTRQNNEQVSISILNNQGKKVDEIRVERNPSNEININWNKGDLPGGIYYLVIKTEKEQISEKFIIL